MGNIRSIAVMATAVSLVAGMATAQNCPSDFDDNGSVGGEDLSRLLGAWGSCSGCAEDLNQDGLIDGADLSKLLAGWGACPGGGGEGSGPFNYGKALQAAVLFYEAQKSGELPEENRLSWRGDAYLNAGSIQVNGDYDVDLRNRYMDAGDSSTFVLPISSAMTLLAWSVVEYRDAYVGSQQLDYMLSNLRWHADWILEAHPEPNVFCGQVGEGSPSHEHWVPDEVYPDSYIPKAFWLTPEHPGSEPAAEAAAFLAAASIAFDETEPEYAAQLLEHAGQLHDFADTYRGLYHETITDVDPFYRSWSGYFDELAWSAAWLYKATGNQAWLEKAKSIYDANFLDGNVQWTHNWDDKRYGASVLLSALTGEQRYRDDVERWLDFWTTGDLGSRIAYTPGGLAWLSAWGSLRYTANTAFLAFLYSDLVGDTADARYFNFAKSQVDYILGSNPRESSYICGFGNNPPMQPHHRCGSGVYDGNVNWPQDNRHILYGALVGGPASADDFDWADVRGDYIANEVACDYNAGITGALARMYLESGGDPFPNGEFPPQEDPYGEEFFVEAGIISSSARHVDLRCLLNNRSAWPAGTSSALSYRIFVDLSELFDAGYELGDAFATSTFNSGATVSDPLPWDESRGIYAVEVDFTGTEIVPGTGSSYWREAQIRIGVDDDVPTSAWDISNDPSLADLLADPGVLKREMIAVYDAGVLVFGEEGSADCNDNGVPDADEIADGSAQDTDGNGRPDECDPDCDGDGLVDRYAIQQGLVGDCDGDFVPDSCEIAGGSADKDGNGVPDSCEVEGINARFTVSDDWGTGFVAEMTFTNNSEEPIPAAWVIEFDAMFEIINVWQGQLQSQSGGHVEITAPEWSDIVNPGESFGIGFQGSYSSGSIDPPENVTLNGAPVRVE